MFYYHIRDTGQTVYFYCSCYICKLVKSVIANVWIDLSERMDSFDLFIITSNLILVLLLEEDITKKKILEI